MHLNFSVHFYNECETILKVLLIPYVFLHSLGGSTIRTGMRHYCYDFAHFSRELIAMATAPE